jgi:hypothetical protein
MSSVSQIQLQPYWKASDLAFQFKIDITRALALASHCNLIDPNGDDYKTPAICFAELRNANAI